ncbi:hypothetical protein M409DRAFT_54513 [Zasmidium cellare ATCC 36951]|uniref:F-box domain-containing protein n=1 Tax=Zasmidium cellare ATCC 36951 TaxID=1080233 RepID=A0A6A6CKN5_ZASCE|nr:uncharacterized protein M409DRAFT_54513 [Zasmidium cellare ATCC 36951]KAF2166720.1 hypothetical protein M409DRAFT_54513 [Zasmidium cellare ATCC 36951]
MPTTPPPPVANPSLGTLERLPAELRNHIYQLAIDTEYELEAAYNKPCRQRQSLHLVSKQIHAETKGFLVDAKARPCPHVNFAVTITELPETPSALRMLEGIAQQTHPAHDIASPDSPLRHWTSRRRRST